MKKQFYNIYPVKVDYNLDQNRINKLSFIENEQKQFLNKNKNRPSNIDYFEKLLESVKNNKNKKRLIAGYFCNMIPKEIFSAMGIDSVRLDCGNNILASFGEEIFSNDICTLSKASLGNCLNKDSIANSCDFIVIPVTCDAKKKMGEIINDFKPVFMFSIPLEQDSEKYIKNSIVELKRFIKFIENNFNLKLKKNNLIKEIHKSNQITHLIREMQNIRANNPQTLRISDLFIIIQSLLFGKTDNIKWAMEVRKVIYYMKTKENEKKNFRNRVILTGSPVIWPNFKILNLLEECQTDVIADTLCSGLMSLYDPVIITEKSKEALLRSLANRYIYASICPCFISQTNRINRIIDLYSENKIDHVINYSLRLCPLFDIENFRIEKILKSKNIPYLNIRTDYSLEDTEQLRIRLEAFLEK